MSLDSSVFTGLSNTFKLLDSATEKHLVTNKYRRGEREVASIVVDLTNLSVAAPIGTFIALEEVQAGQLLLPSTVVSLAGGTSAAPDLVVVTKSGTVLQTLAAGVDLSAAGTDTLFAQTATATAVEVTQSGILAWKVTGAVLPTTFKQTILLESLVV